MLVRIEDSVWCVHRRWSLIGLDGDRCQSVIPLLHRTRCHGPWSEWPPTNPIMISIASHAQTTTQNRAQRNPTAPNQVATPAVKPRVALTRNVLLGVLEVLEQRLVVPVNALVDVGGGVGETLDLAGLTAEETVEVRADLVGLAGADGVALSATGLRE